MHLMMPLHWPHAGVHSNPILRQMNAFVSHLQLQLHLIILELLSHSDRYETSGRFFPTLTLMEYIVATPSMHLIITTMALESGCIICQWKLLPSEVTTFSWNLATRVELWLGDVVLSSCALTSRASSPAFSHFSVDKNGQMKTEVDFSVPHTS